ncbi:MAG: hypothetical protein JKY37_30320 [Nannocystaceae bacterium]|nr:hypothetical protein [Nannocystaceae bacterium]
MKTRSLRVIAACGGWFALLTSAGCSEADGLMRALPAEVSVKFDFDHRPLPDIPFPNDIATRPDPTSRTGLRVNASMVAATGYERQTRRLIDGLDGWGVYQPISIPFDGPIDITSVTSRHSDADYDTSNDAIYLINIDRDSENFGELRHLDIGNGNYPIVAEDTTKYGDNDPRGWLLSISFDEEDEDRNGNGKLDPSEDRNHNGLLDPGEDLNGNGIIDGPEDTDADGVLDKPNYRPGHNPARDDLAGRADALMSFYEQESNTLLVAPLEPLDEQTRYAVVVTRRVHDMDGDPVGSPFPFINHTAQTDDLEALFEVLPPGVDAEDVAFTFSYTTESITNDWVLVREGLYGLGPQGHIGEMFPPDITSRVELKTVSGGVLGKFEGRSPYLLFQEDWSHLLTFISGGFFGGLDASSQQYASVIGTHDYIDFHAMGTYKSPQLFERRDKNGDRLSLDLQSWPDTLDYVPAEVRSEEIPWWVVMPRKEVSARAKHEQLPLVLLGHGYGSNRAGELMGFAGFLSMYGMATISTDNVSHGVPIEPEVQAEFGPVLANEDLGPVLDALAFSRSEDLDNDGIIDSGVDFWTAYLFHTRDMVRQSALDYMQLIRIVRSWDGVKTWPYDVNQDGKDDLAGDFDGDGYVDIGSESKIYMLGASLGGIMATMMGAVEPEIEAIIPIAGGGRMSDIGSRSKQGGIPQAIVQRVMGPLFQATVRDDGVTELYTEVVEGNRAPRIQIGTLDPCPPGVSPCPGQENPDQLLLAWDTVVGVNLDNGEIGCSYVVPDEVADNGVAGRARVAVASDVGDRIELRFYRGSVLEVGSEDCEVIEDAEPFQVINRLEAPLDAEGMPITFEGVPIKGGELVALAEGFGLQRGTPGMRRFLGLAQLVLDRCDPGVMAAHLTNDPIVYPNKGDQTNARFLFVTTVGDMNVPASSGITVGRAAGVIDFLNIDPRYGKPVNQVLLDTYTAEAVNVFNRIPYRNVPQSENLRTLLGLDASGGSHVDVENFSEGTDMWEDNLTRLDPGLHLVMDEDMWGNKLNGLSGAIFPFAIPEGQHGFPLPGQMTDSAIQLCKERNGSGAPECATDLIVGKTFDTGWYMFHLIGKYLAGSTNLFDPTCVSRTTCDYAPEFPEPRPLDSLP